MHKLISRGRTLKCIMIVNSQLKWKSSNVSEALKAIIALEKNKLSEVQDW